MISEERKPTKQANNKITGAKRKRNSINFCGKVIKYK